MPMTLKNSVILLLISHIIFLYWILFIWWKIFRKRSAVQVFLIIYIIIFLFMLVSKYNSTRFIIYLTHRTFIFVNLLQRWFIIYKTSILFWICLNYWVSMHVINLGNKYTFVVEVFISITVIEIQIDWVSCFFYIDFWIAKCSVLNW